MLSTEALSAALDAWKGLEMSNVRVKSVALCELFIKLVETRCANFCGEGGLQLASPRDSSIRGSQVGLGDARRKTRDRTIRPGTSVIVLY